MFQRLHVGQYLPNQKLVGGVRGAGAEGDTKTTGTGGFAGAGGAAGADGVKKF